MRVQANTRGRPVRTLATAAEMEPQTLLHVVVEIAVSSTRIAKAKVGSPTLQIPIEFLNQNGNRFETKPAAGHFPQRCPFLRQGLLRGNNVQITQSPAMPAALES